MFWIDFTWLNYLQVAAVSSFTVISLSLYFYGKNKHTYWQRKGVKGPKPYPIVGTFLENVLGNRMELKMQRLREYGKIYGAYMGLRPILLISDPEVIQQISIKDFDIFPNHSFTEDAMSNKYSQKFLIALKDQHWRKVRAFMSPTFTSGKIRRMFRLLDGCADDMVCCFREHIPAGEQRAVVNAKELYNLYTMDAIATCCYGLKLERSGSKNLKTAATRDEFVNLAMKQFDSSFWRTLAAMTIPKEILAFFKFNSSPPKKIIPLADKVRVLVEKRRSTTKKFDDYLQLLVDAKLDAEMELDELDQAENHHAGLTHDSLIEDQRRMLEELQTESGQKGTKLALSDIEILANAIFLLIVGLETTGTLLTHVTCILAFNREIQEKLYQEVLTLAEYNEDKTKLSFNYDKLTSSRYLDAVISETLRFYPPVLEIDRMSNAPYRIEKYNIDLAAQTRVFLNFHAVQNDPDYWEQPEKFNPERFMPGNREKIVPGTYCPFGIGPRHCIGMRFSLTEAKLALAKLIVNFRFVPTPGAKWPIEPKRSFGLNNIKDPSVTIEARE